MENILELHNCHIVTPFKEIESGDIIIADGKIIEIKSADIRKASKSNRTIDVNGRITGPGFIDVHIQGAGGFDVLDTTSVGLETISKTCLRFGVTGFVATTVFKKDQKNEHLSIAAENTGNDFGGAELLGIHIEGPFISPERRGMIQSDSISKPDKRILKEIYAITGKSLRIVTIAPEIEGCLKIIESICEQNTVASFGHSLASYEQTLNGIKAGISHVTHLLNAMNSIHHREPGPLPAIVENESVTAQVIFDGVHIHPAVLRLTCKLLGPERIVLITDGMQAMGLPEGFYEYDGVEYESRDGTARYQDGTLIGTTLGMCSILERFIKFSGSSLCEAFRCASLNPAKVLGIENRKGSIEKGKDGDLVILDHDFSVWKTIKGGKIVYEQ